MAASSVPGGLLARCRALKASWQVPGVVAEIDRQDVGAGGEDVVVAHRSDAQANGVAVLRVRVGEFGARGADVPVAVDAAADDPVGSDVGHHLCDREAVLGGPGFDRDPGVGFEQRVHAAPAAGTAGCGSVFCATSNSRIAITRSRCRLESTHQSRPSRRNDTG